MEQIQVHLKHIILPSNYSEKLKSILHGREVARAQGFCSGAVEKHQALTGRVQCACTHLPHTCHAQVPDSTMAGSHTPAAKSQRMTSKALTKPALVPSLCQFLAQYCPAFIFNAEINRKNIF